MNLRDEVHLSWMMERCLDNRQACLSLRASGEAALLTHHRNHGKVLPSDSIQSYAKVFLSKVLERCGPHDAEVLVSN